MNEEPVPAEKEKASAEQRTAERSPEDNSSESSSSMDSEPCRAGADSEQHSDRREAAAGPTVINNNTFNLNPPHPARDDHPPREKEEIKPPLSLTEVSTEWKLLKPRFHFASDSVSGWCSALTREHILLMTSYDSSVLFSAAKATASQLQARYKPYLVRALAEEEQERLDPLLRKANDPAALFVIDAPLSLPQFLNRALREHSELDWLRQSLLHNSRRLLVLTNERCLGWSENPEAKRFAATHNCHVEVQFLAPRLEDQMRDWERTHAEILEQRDAGLWAADEERFYQEMNTALGRETLAGEIEKRRKGKVISVARSQADRLVSPPKPLDNAALFVATFFPNLLMQDFQRLLLALLGEREQAVTSSILVVGPDGDGHTEDMSAIRPLRELWRESYVAVLERCCLQVVRGVERGDGGMTASVVDFSTPELHEALRDSFFGTHSAVLQELLHALRDAREEMGESIEIASSAARLMVDAAALDRHELSGPGLGGWLPALSPPENEDEGERPERRISWAFYRPYLRALLQSPALRDLVTGRYLPDLLRARRYADVLDIVWALRDTAGFSAFPWLKRLCDSGDELTCLLVCDLLRRAVRQNGSAEMVRAAYGWLSPAGERVEAPPSAEIAKRFFIGLNEGLLFHPTGPSPLLAAAQRAGGEELIEISVSWLFHPAAAAGLLRQRFAGHIAQWARHWLVPQAIRSIVYDQPAGEPLLAALQHQWQETANDDLVQSAPLHALFFPAVVIADWAAEFLGQDPLPPDSGAILDRLAPALARACSGERRLALETLWSTVEDSLLEVLIWIERLDPRPEELDAPAVRTLRDHLTGRRRAIQQLRRELRSRSHAQLS